MTNVFLSRPTWVGSQFQNGLQNFLGFLDSHDLCPRTIGVSDYPNKSPLDEVIALMAECKGAIIMGYPQIRLETGVLKDVRIPNEATKELLLPTEWNHIEAGLAFARGLPLLVIHHLGVVRGVFDRGAINNFIYQVDLSDATWPLLPQIKGAFVTWKKDVLKIEPTQKDEVSEALSETALTLLGEIESSNESVTKGISLMLASGNVGFYTPYLWDPMLHSGGQRRAGDISAVIAAVDELCTAGYLEFHDAGGQLQQFRRTRKTYVKPKRDVNCGET